MRLLDVGCGWGGMVDARGASTTACRRSASRCPRARPSSRRSASPRPGSPTGSRSACRTTATSTTARSTRSARSACSSTWARRGSAEYFAPAATTLLRARGPAAQPRHQPAAGRRQAQATFSAPRLHRPVRVPRRRAARGRHASCRDAASRLRGAPRREPARALRADAAALGREPRGAAGTRPCESSARPRARSGASTWPASAVNFEANRTQIHQVLAVKPDDGRSGMPLRPTGTHAADSG